MAVFKRKYTAKNGKAKATQKWSVDFRDHDGVMRRIAAFTDKSASLELERHLNRLVALRMAGSGPDTELSRFLESCPGDIREKLGEWNIITDERAAAGKPLATHLEDWRQDMTNDGLTHKQIVANVNKVTAIADDCGWLMISDMSATDMNTWRNNQKRSGKAAQTLNHYLVVANVFCHWLMEKKD